MSFRLPLFAKAKKRQTVRHFNKNVLEARGNVQLWTYAQNGRAEDILNIKREASISNGFYVIGASVILRGGFAIFLANLKGIIRFDIFPIKIQPFINLPVIHTQPAQNLLSQYSISAPFGIRYKSFNDFNARVSSQTFWNAYINMPMAFDQNLVVFIDKKKELFSN